MRVVIVKTNNVNVLLLFFIKKKTFDRINIIEIIFIHILPERQKILTEIAK